LTSGAGRPPKKSAHWVEEPRRIHAAAAAARPSPAPKKADLPRIIGRIADDKRYGVPRRGYVKAVAEAGDVGAAIPALTAAHFGGDAKAHGGTHRQIERLWASLGGTDWAPQLITDTADGKQVMLPEAREWAILYANLEDLHDKLSD
jgi:hypothetical protein